MPSAKSTLLLPHKNMQFIEVPLKILPYYSIDVKYTYHFLFYSFTDIS